MGCVSSRKEELGAPRPDGKNKGEVINGDEGVWSMLEDTAYYSKIKTSNSSQNGSVEGTCSKQSSGGLKLGPTITGHSGPGLHFDNSISSNSQLRYSDPDQTIIFFDWDDTLCPSSWIRCNVQFNRRGRPTNRFQEREKCELFGLSDQVIPLLRLAKTLGKVVLVTNARRPWVSTSCMNFLPDVLPELENIDIVYAMELLAEGETKPHANPSLLTESKARAMKKAVAGFYSQYAKQSWKNVLSIGDALYEHDAIRQVTNDRPSAGKKCRTKTIKLVEGPCTTVITKQLCLVESWLQKIVCADYDIDIDLSADMQTLQTMMERFGAFAIAQDRVEEEPNGLIDC